MCTGTYKLYVHFLRRFTRENLTYTLKFNGTLKLNRSEKMVKENQIKGVDMKHIEWKSCNAAVKVNLLEVMAK